MVVRGTARVTCPACGAKHDSELVQSINTHTNPRDKQRLLDGELNVLACTCGKRTQLAANVLFHDPEAQYYCQVVPGGDRAMNEGAAAFAAAGVSGTLRLVPSLNALAEKVKLLDAGLIDWAIEMTKVLLLASISPVGAGPPASVSGSPVGAGPPASISGSPVGAGPSASISGSPVGAGPPASISGPPVGAGPPASISGGELDRVLLFDSVDHQAGLLRWVMFDPEGRTAESVSSPLAAYEKLATRDQSKPSDRELRIDRAWGVEAVRQMVANAN